jgi:hypothetical protein
MKSIDMQVLSFLERSILKQEILYSENSDTYFHEIYKKMPVENGKINWDKLKYCKKWNMMDSNLSTRFDEIIDEIFDIIFEKKLCAKDENIILIFDGNIDGFLEMNYRYFRIYYKQIFALPEHTYIFSQNLSWIISYTFTDMLYFGIL